MLSVVFPEASTAAQNDRLTVTNLIAMSSAILYDAATDGHCSRGANPMPERSDNHRMHRSTACAVSQVESQPSVPGDAYRSATEAVVSRKRNPLLIAIGLLLCIAAFLRGQYLLGTSAAVTFFLLVAASTFVVYRVFITNRRHNIARRTIASLFATSVFALLCFAPIVSPNIASLSSRHRTQIRTETQLRDILTPDSRFAHVRATCEAKKALFVTIHGRVQSSTDLMELRARLLAECPDIEPAFLYWRLSVDDSNELYEGRDSDIFGDVNMS